MSWENDLEAVVKRTGTERYRWLTSDDNPDSVARERYRAEMVRMAKEPVIERAAAPMAHQTAAAPAVRRAGGCCGGGDPFTF